MRRDEKCGKTRSRGTKLHFPGSHGRICHTHHACYGARDPVVHPPPQGAQRRARSRHWCSGGGGSNPPDRPAEPRPLHPALVEPKRHSPLPLCSREPRDQLGSCDSRAWRLTSVTLATAGPPQTVRESGEFRSKGR